MKTLLKISWRNIWRNRTRSLVIMSAIVLGLMGGIFSASLRLGIEQQQFKDTIENQISHIQIHNPEFIANPEARFHIPDGFKIADQLNQRADIKIAAARTVFDGMASSASNNTGARIKGIEPAIEAMITGLEGLLTDGTYFSENGRLPSVIIGRELASKLNVGTGSRIVLTFQDKEGEVISASFRVEGLYSVTAKSFEERTVFVRAAELNALIGDYNAVTEIALLLEDLDNYRSVTEDLKGLYPDQEIRHWADLAPFLYFSLEFLGRSLIWLVGIVILGVSFGLLNTILMSVLERVRELGVLMAIGMKKARIFAMILFETTIMSMAGGLVGLVLSFLMIRYLNKRGVNLANLGGEGLGEYGYASVIYPNVETGFYFQIGLLVVVFAILASIYPAWKAIKLSPVEAVRKE